MKIEFYTPPSETIPTKLRLLIDDKEQVVYSPLRDAFGYEFTIYNAASEERAKEIFDRCVSIMCSQSYDHGAQWRAVHAAIKPDGDDYFRYYVGVVTFRVRDAN